MNLIPWKGKRSDDTDLMWPGSALGTLRSEMDRVFDRLLPGFWSEPSTASGTSFFPNLNVSETETEVTVRADLPGVDAENLNLTVTGQVLTLSGEKKESFDRKEENFHQTERRFGSFRRSIQLPMAVNPEKVTAEHKNGVLYVRLQKQPGAAGKKIPVQAVKE